MQQKGLNYTCVQKYELSDDTVHGLQSCTG